MQVIHPFFGNRARMFKLGIVRVSSVRIVGEAVVLPYLIFFVNLTLKKCQT